MARPQVIWTNSFLVMIVLAGCVVLATVAAGAPQQTAAKDKAAAGKEVVNETAKTGKAGAADANIKSDTEKNNPNAKAKQSARAPGESFYARRKIASLCKSARG